MEVVSSVSEIIGDPKQVIMNDQSLSAAAAGNLQQRPITQASPVPLQSPQSQSYNSMSNGGYKPGPGHGPQHLNGIYPKENVGMGAGAPHAYTSPNSKPAHSVGYQAQGFGSSGGNAQGAGGGLIYTNPQASPYGRPVVAPSSYQPAPLYSNRGPIVKNEAPARIVPIAALNPYQGRWTIKARVTAKGELRRFHNAKGEGKVFHFDLLDAEGGEIRVTCFNNIADQFHERIELGNVYLISKGSLKAAQRSFNHLKNEWEIFLENSSTVERCFEEDNAIPFQQFDFRPISEIESMEGNTMVDIIGVVVSINPSATIMRKNGTETQKRSLQLRDTSGRSVEVTIWGSFCSNEGQQLQDLCDSGHCPVLAVKAGRVSDFSGKSVGTISSSQLLVNPNLPQAIEVKEWFEQVGKNMTSLSISREGASGTRVDMRKSVSQIKDEGLGRSEKPDWIALKATISYIKTDTFCYTACPLPIGDRQCNKKVINNGDGTWRCDRCDKAVAECDYRYLLSVQVQDHTGVTWITAFQEAGEEIMGVSAKELYMWKQDESLKYGELIQKLLFSQHLFKLKVKEENYNDEQRVKSTVVKSDKLDYAAESKVLIDMIGKLFRGEEINESSSTVAGASAPGHFRCGGSTVAQVGPSGGGSYGGNMYSGSVPAAFGGHANGTSNSYGGGGNMYSGSVPAAFGGGQANGLPNGYGGGVSCFKCGGGHLARDCPGMGPSNDFGGGFNAGGQMGGGNTCFKCGQGGHWARDCPGQGGSGGFGREASYGGTAGYARGY